MLSVGEGTGQYVADLEPVIINRLLAILTVTDNAH